MPDVKVTRAGYLAYYYNRRRRRARNEGVGGGIRSYLADEDAGFVALFAQAIPEVYIKDPSTPANEYLGVPSAKITTFRNAVGWYFDRQGLLKQAAIHTQRYTFNPETLTAEGLLSEEARTNVVLWNRDLANAAWAKTSVTATKDQMGMDNGSTWTAITPSGTGWQRKSIPAQTLANPTVGFRIGTSGDSFAIDLVQNENGLFKSSPHSHNDGVCYTHRRDAYALTSCPPLGRDQGNHIRRGQERGAEQCPAFVLPDR